MRARCLIWVIASAVWAVAQGADLLSPPPDIEVSRNADEYMSAHAAAGTFSGAVLIAREGEPVFAKGYGYANAEWRVPNGIKTKFRLGSVTKQFTATLVMQMQNAGKLAVGDSICKYLEPCPQTWQAVTIEHLLTHTSGIPSYTDEPDFLITTRLPKTKDEIVATFRDKPLLFTPGSEHRYSNSGYFLLGLILEKVGKMPYEALLAANILDPLQMRDSGYDRHEAILPQRASGYRLDAEGELANAEYLDMAWPYAAGAMYSTVEDLLKWDRALYSDAILPQQVLRTMWTPYKDNYGYGWQIFDSAPDFFDRRVVLHGGGINGFSTLIVRYLDDRTTVVVLANLVSAPVARIAHDLSAIAFGEPYSLPKQRTAVKVPVEVLDAYVGEYELRPGFVFVITREGERLYVQPTGQGKSPIFPESATEFFSKIVDAQISFAKDASGRVTGLVLHQNGNDVPGKKIK